MTCSNIIYIVLYSVSYIVYSYSTPIYQSLDISYIITQHLTVSHLLMLVCISIWTCETDNNMQTRESERDVKQGQKDFLIRSSANIGRKKEDVVGEAYKEYISSMV